MILTLPHLLALPPPQTISPLGTKLYYCDFQAQIKLIKFYKVITLKLFTKLTNNPRIQDVVA